jgi:hypothetical protein
MYYDDDDPDQYDYADMHFADPGSGSALRAGVRDQRCPTCKYPNRLTQEDVSLHYQCDACADAQEKGIDGPYNEEYDEELQVTDSSYTDPEANR